MNVWQSKADDYSIVQCAMLYGLEPRLQRRFERHGAYEMFQELKLIFQANARIERYEGSNKFDSCKMEENSSASEHILNMSGYNIHLIQLGINLADDCVIDRILQTLPPSYKSFVMNYKMQSRSQAVLGRQYSFATPWVTERHGYDPTTLAFTRYNFNSATSASC